MPNYQSGWAPLPALRMLVAPVRSGTTALLHQMSQSPHVDTATGVMRWGLRATGTPDYGIYSMSSQRPFLFHKTTFGHRTIEECSYEPFRSPSDVARVRPVFVFRDPVQTLNSWRSARWIGSDLRRFVVAYQWTLTLFQRSMADSTATRCITYEHLATEPAAVMPQLFSHWGIPYDEHLLHWRTALGDGTIRHPQLLDQRAKLTQHLQQGLHRNLATGPADFHLVVNEIVLNDREVSAVEREFRSEYDIFHVLGQRFFPSERMQFSATATPAATED